MVSNAPELTSVDLRMCESHPSRHFTSYPLRLHSYSDEFYSLFYLGLFNEARGDSSKAESYMRASVQTKYAKAVGSKDYMVDVAKVHCQLRHWTH